MEASQVMGGTLYKSSSGVSFPERPEWPPVAGSGHPHREPMHEVEAQVTAAHTPLRPGTIWCAFLYIICYIYMLYI